MFLWDIWCDCTFFVHLYAMMTTHERQRQGEKSGWRQSAFVFALAPYWTYKCKGCYLLIAFVSVCVCCVFYISVSISPSVPVPIKNVHVLHFTTVFLAFDHNKIHCDWRDICGNQIMWKCVKVTFELCGFSSWLRIYTKNVIKWFWAFCTNFDELFYKQSLESVIDETQKKIYKLWGILSVNGSSFILILIQFQ